MPRVTLDTDKDHLVTPKHSDARERYTQLSVELEKILNDAPQLALGDLNKRLAVTDQMFTGMNDDCVNMAKQ